MGRLIYADKLNEEFDDLITTFENTKNGKDYISKEELLECLKLLRGCVDEQPTGYDVEKVVAELEKDSYEEYFSCLEIVRLKDAIGVVRKGGIDG